MLRSSVAALVSRENSQKVEGSLDGINYVQLI